MTPRDVARPARSLRGDRRRAARRWSSSSRAPAAISAPAPTSANSRRSIATPRRRATTAEAIQQGLQALVALDRPTIAALRGDAIGGGLALALCCDLRFCADDAFLAITPARLGLLYGFVETRRLVETSARRAPRTCCSAADAIACAEALAIGLIDRLVPAGELEATIGAYAGELARLSQRSIRGAKRAVEAIAGGLGEETPAFRAMVEGAAAGEDFAEGRSAFLDKRAPQFRFRGRLDPL